MKAAQLEDEAMALANNLSRALRGSGRHGLGSVQNLTELSAIEDQTRALQAKLVELRVVSYKIRQEIVRTS